MTNPFGSADYSIDVLDDLSPDMHTLDQHYQEDGVIWRRKLPDANAAAQRMTALLAQQSAATLPGEAKRSSRLTSITLPDTSLGGVYLPNAMPQPRQRTGIHRARSYLAVAAMLVVVVLLGLLLHAYASGRAIGPTHDKTPIASATSAVTATPGSTTMPYTFPATWKNGNGGLTIDNNSYAFAPTNQQVGYACDASSSLLYKTSDGGNSWHTLAGTPFVACSGVFIDGQDASDVFIQLPAAAGQSMAQLWRSRNGGASWQKLGHITGSNLPPLSWGNLAVVNGRIVGAAQINGEGTLPDPLYFSDDGGMTWQTLAQTIVNQGNALDATFAVAGTVIYINGVHGTGPAGLRSQPISGNALQLNPMDQLGQLSGNPPAQQLFWRSTDGGASWMQVTLPGGLPIFVHAATGDNYYAVSALTQQIGQDDNGTPIYDTTLWWSRDSGATWKKLPDLRGIEHGYVMGSSPSIYTLVIAPDGTVFVPAFHSAQSAGDDAGVFMLNPNRGAFATWQPLVAGGVQYWQVVTTSTGLRLWGAGSFGNDQHLKYVDIA